MQNHFKKYAGWQLHKKFTGKVDSWRENTCINNIPVEYKKENKERKRREYFRELTNFKKFLSASDYNQLFVQPETIDILCQVPITYTTTIMP